VEHYREYGRIISKQVFNWMKLLQDCPAVDIVIRDSLIRRQFLPGSHLLDVHHTL
jgi:hypothetical protein